MQNCDTQLARFVELAAGRFDQRLCFMVLSETAMLPSPPAPSSASEPSRCDAVAVTRIQRIGTALNLNIYFHMLFLNGVHVGGPGEAARVSLGQGTDCVSLS